MFVQCFPWTFHGMHELLQDYVPCDPLHAELFMNEYTEVPVIGDFGRWWRYIHDHMHQVVLLVSYFTRTSDLWRNEHPDRGMTH